MKDCFRKTAAYLSEHVNPDAERFLRVILAHRFREDDSLNLCISQRTELAESCQEFGWISFCSFHHINQPGGKVLGSSLYSKEYLPICLVALWLYEIRMKLS